ncbi:DUF397 domain-containing protein [Actinomadura sp. 9N407]|uniref:DUF397 domain-containing protein n=1 Tax=Actinomadura sp. 9N407 TaxID=3375154 RepID=UPI00378FA45F
MVERDLGCIDWRKSSRSGSSGGDCVEVARLDIGNAIRDSKHPEGGFLLLDRDACATLLTQIKHGSYDL